MLGFSIKKVNIIIDKNNFESSPATLNSQESNLSSHFAWRTTKSCVFKNFIHLVFVTKYRRGVFTGEMITRLHSIFKEVCIQMSGHLWSPSYCVVSCGGAPLDSVKQYVADQRRPE